MTAVPEIGIGKTAVAPNASAAINGMEKDVENGESQPSQAQFGDQSSRLPRSKIITVSTPCSCPKYLSSKYELSHEIMRLT